MCGPAAGCFIIISAAHDLSSDPPEGSSRYDRLLSRMGNIALLVLNAVLVPCTWYITYQNIKISPRVADTEKFADLLLLYRECHKIMWLSRRPPLGSCRGAKGKRAERAPCRGQAAQQEIKTHS